MYDPIIGRWFAPDPYGQYPSPYLVMGNNPVSSVDPDGGCSQNGKVVPCPEGVSNDLEGLHTAIMHVAVASASRMTTSQKFNYDLRLSTFMRNYVNNTALNTKGRKLNSGSFVDIYLNLCQT